MPALPARSQPESGAVAWFGCDAGRRLLLECQRQAVPELTRVFGHSGLYLRPSSEFPAALSGNMLASVLSLHRDAGRLGGELRCADAELPVASSSLSLVYAQFVLETSPAPEALVAEIARVLKPEGVLMLLALNPLSPIRWRWAMRGLRMQPVSALSLWTRAAGLEQVRLRHLGPVWSLPSGRDFGAADDARLLAPLRVANLLVARRRDGALTPLRRSAPAVSMKPGISAG